MLDLAPISSAEADAAGLPSWLVPENLAFNMAQDERFYFQMALIRALDTTLLDLFSQNELAGTTHTSMGQEANAVGIINALERDIDTVWSNHRCHGHFLAYCGDALGLIAEIMGRVTGVCAGRGGSQHLCRGHFHSNGIQGGIVPVAVGAALARRHLGAITTVFLGDGTMGEGVVYESLNIAALWSAPLLLVVEDNGIAQTTPKALGVAGSIVERAKPFGIETFHYGGTDVYAVHEIARRAIDYVRGEGRPAWLVIDSQRIGPHSKGDDTRDAATIATAKAADPLALLRPRLAAGVADEIEARCRRIVDDAVAAAREAPVACAS